MISRAMQIDSKAENLHTMSTVFSSGKHKKNTVFTLSIWIQRPVQKS